MYVCVNVVKLCMWPGSLHVVSLDRQVVGKTSSFGSDCD